MRKSKAIILISILAILLFTGACSASPALPAVSTPAANPTVAEFAGAGKAVFVARCQECHGDQGKGSTAPALIGENNNLGKYNTAKRLFDYISTTMPFNAPGSLSQQDYIKVIVFLLVQNNLITADTVVDPDSFSTLSLKK